jgi:hypothetical protein
MKLKLTEDEAKALQELADRTGKSVDGLIHETIAKLTKENRMGARPSLQIAKGLWKDREERH